LAKRDAVPAEIYERAGTLTPDDYEVSPDGYVVCYTDGACTNNGRRGATAGLGVFFGPGHKM
jgi:hypothetical protein